MGRGLGIFLARPKTPFVPGGATTRDKRSFCPGWWLHPGPKGLLSRVVAPPGTKAPPYISSPRPLFQHLATSAPSILLAAVVPSSAPPRPRAPHRRPESSAPPPRDPETAAASWPRPPPGGRPRPVRHRRPPRVPPGGLPCPKDRLPEHRAQRIDALRGLVVPDLRLARAPPPSPTVAVHVCRRDLAAVSEHAGLGPPPPRPPNPTIFVN